MFKSISTSSMERLCSIYGLLEEMGQIGQATVSSSELGNQLGIEAHNIRKDINCLGEIGTVGSGYDTGKLKQFIGEHLGLDLPHKICVVGLGRLGSALLFHDKFNLSGYTIVAGFDSSINRLEMLQTAIPVYPSYELETVVLRLGIEYAFLAVPAPAASEMAGRLIKSGVRGIINFTPTALTSQIGRASCRERV
jgi:redox-sensing transcriptional repressor